MKIVVILSVNFYHYGRLVRFKTQLVTAVMKNKWKGSG